MRTGDYSRTHLRMAVIVVLLTGAIAAGVVRWQTAPRRRLLSAAHALRFRPVEGRLAETFDYRPYRAASPQRTAIPIGDQADRSPEARRFTATALLFAQKHDAALAILSELLGQGAEESDSPAAMQRSTDADLLIDFSAAALQRPADRRSVVLAYEAADRAWRLTRAPSAAWNRAIAVDRLGMPAFAARAWGEIAAKESTSGWGGEAATRREASARRAAAPPDASLELFFYRRLISQAIAGEPLTDVVAGDHLATDAAAALRRLSTHDRQRVNAALLTYLHGRDSFEHNDYEDARRSYAAAETKLRALDVPLFLLARDQRIRSECSQGTPGCVEAMHAFRQEVSGLRKYPWLAARAAYGEGQVLYRMGHIYEASGHLQHALAEFEKFGDATSAGFMHVLLANVFAAGGESELALGHFLDGVACHTPAIRDRRRKILEDAIAFMLRHGYVATAELFLEDLAASSTTEASDVNEAMLRGVIACRRGDRRAAALHFQRGRALLRDVKDDASRADVQFRLAIAEAGSQIFSANPILGELDHAIAAHEKTEHSIWLPQLLTERGSAYEKRNDPAHAEIDYRRAIDILESREPRIDETVLALGIAGGGESPFDRAIRLLLREGRIAGALSIAERSNALRISSLHARGAGVRDAFSSSRGEGDGIGELQKGLPPGQIAIAHHLLKDELITWIVRRDTIRATRRPVERNELLQGGERLRRCAVRSCNDEPAVESLSNALLRPWIDGVPRGTTLLIQPPAELESVAYSMLRTGAGERLVMRNALATAPSFRAFVRAMRTDRTRAAPLSAFFAAAPVPGGDLDALPLAKQEVERASRSYANVQTAPHASRTLFLARSPSFAIVHFAGHVLVNAARPLFSALAFESGELLYVHELDERSFASARLVVLSACDTGRSPRPTMSVANALLSQNVPSVVYTLWPVADEVAEAFAVPFHEAIARGKTRADAVRDAQLSLMQQWPNEPGAWAAFAIAGAPGPLMGVEKGEDV
ncbi:MAG: CHAT domain-containing protein [Acidobacteriota bacterium]